MTLEQMCCTQEQSKRLRELGIEQRSYFYWTTLPHIIHLDYVPAGESWDKDLVASAFLSGELIMMIPEAVTDLDLMQWGIEYKNHHKNFGMQYRDDSRSPLGRTFPDHCVFGDTEAQARAKMLIHLLEERIIKSEQVNKRLHE